MNVGEDANIIALAKVIRDEELEENEETAEKTPAKNEQEQMQF